MNNTKTAQIAIVGAGSIGCYLGGCLITAGADVLLIGRERIQQQLAEHGMRLTDWQARDTHIDKGKIKYSLVMSDISKADYIIVTVKSGDTEKVAADIATHAKDDAVIVSYQNGVRNGPVLQRVLPNHRVLKGMVPFNVLSQGNGHFHCGTEGNLALEDKHGVANALVEFFERGNLAVDVYHDLTGIQWTKLLMNLNNAINALSGIPLLEQFSNAKYRKVVALMLKEALKTMSVAGIEPVKNGKVVPKAIPFVLRLPTMLYKIVAGSMLKIDPNARSSMYEDLDLRRKTEVDFINGEIVDLAKQHGQTAPINSTIVKLIKEAEQKNSGSPGLSANDLLKQISVHH